jgi:hypothetical protein
MVHTSVGEQLVDFMVDTGTEHSVVTSILGIVHVIKKISLKERHERKKCMGVWKWKSELTAKMIIRFPRMLSIYMKRNRMKIRNCSPGSSVNPK